MKGRTHTQIEVAEKKEFGWRSRAGLALAVVSLASCATKTAGLHSPPYFAPTEIRQATNVVDAGDGDLEIANLRRVMMSRPDDVEARLRLADAYVARGFPDVALEHYRLASERFPDSEQAAVRLARTLRRAGQKEEALAGLREFIRAHPLRTSEPYEWMGILQDDLQNWSASQQAYETALIYSPENAELHNNLGYTLLMQARKDAAVVEFRSALRLKRDLVIARNNLGIALMDNPKEAILNWQAISGPAAAHNNMAALLIERGDYIAARKELETALGYDQQNAQAIYNLALVAQRDGKPAVVPVPGADKAAVKTAKQTSAWSRFFHPGRRSGNQSDSQSLSAGRTAEPAAVPAASGIGN
jgi:Tfp pilus assembly protein PilF